MSEEGLFQRCVERVSNMFQPCFKHRMERMKPQRCVHMSQAKEGWQRTDAEDRRQSNDGRTDSDRQTLRLMTWKHTNSLTGRPETDQNMRGGVLLWGCRTV